MLVSGWRGKSNPCLPLVEVQTSTAVMETSMFSKIKDRSTIWPSSPIRFCRTQFKGKAVTHWSDCQLCACSWRLCLTSWAHFHARGSRTRAHCFPSHSGNIPGCFFIYPLFGAVLGLSCSLHSPYLLYVSSLFRNHTSDIGGQDRLHFRWSLANLWGLMVIMIHK